MESSLHEPVQTSQHGHHALGVFSADRHNGTCGVRCSPSPSRLCSRSVSSRAIVQSLLVASSQGSNHQEGVTCLWILFLAFTAWKLNDISNVPQILQRGRGLKTCFLKQDEVVTWIPSSKTSTGTKFGRACIGAMKGKLRKDEFILL